MSGNKKIGLWSAVSIGVGGMIGAGIFAILGTATQIAGDAVYLSFIIAGAIALLSTYSYAKLAVKYPSAGGPVEFIVREYGDGLLSGGFNILLWVGYLFALALYASAFAAYAMTFFPDAPGIWRNIFATGIILLFTSVNFIGAKAVGRAEVFIVAVKVGILLLFASIGVFFITPGLLSVSLFPPTKNIFFATAVVFLAYEGFGLITNAAEDMENPEKTLPKALYLSVLIVIAIYLSVSLTVTGNLPLSGIIKAKDYALAEAARPFLGSLGFKIMAIAALFSTSSAINATLYGGANVSYMIAKDGELPRVFERKVWGQSFEGLFITAGLVILFANTFDLSGIAMLGSGVFLIIYGAVHVGHLRIYRKTGANPYILAAALLGCFFALAILVYYLLGTSPATLTALLFVIILSFAGEGVFRRYTNRKLKTRKCKVQS